MIDFYPSFRTEGKKNMEDWITVKEAAEIMNIGEHQVRKLCKKYEDSNGKEGIKSKQPAREWRVWREDAMNYKRQRKKSD